MIEVIPEHYMRHAHHWLILHGRYVCKARKPDCPLCVIADICKADVKTTDIPAPLVELKPVDGNFEEPAPLIVSGRHRTATRRSVPWPI